MVKVSRHTLYLSEKCNKRLGLPHDGLAWILTKPKNVAPLAEEDQFASDPIQLICFVNSFLLLFGQPRKTIWIEIIPQWWWHRLISILYESSSGCCATRWCKMHVHASIVVDKVFDELKVIWVEQI